MLCKIPALLDLYNGTVQSPPESSVRLPGPCVDRPEHSIGSPGACGYAPGLPVTGPIAHSALFCAWISGFFSGNDTPPAHPVHGPFRSAPDAADPQKFRTALAVSATQLYAIAPCSGT